MSPSVLKRISADPTLFPPTSIREQGVRRYPTSRGGLREIRWVDPNSVSAARKAGTNENANDQLFPLEVKAGLEPYSGTLDSRTARHLLRRTGFGASKNEVDAIVGSLAADAVDAIVDAAINNPHPATPAWVATPMPPENATPAEWDAYNTWTFERLDEFRIDWYKLMSQEGLREKLTLFWHDHFATSEDKYYHAQIAQRYIELLRTHALGNFKDFVRAIGLDVAMLVFLDGVENRKGAPNENYARELCELFTMGILDKNGNANYSQQDITEIARSLTGYIVNRDFEVLYFDVIHDNDNKDVFGQVGNWGYDDVVDLVFTERDQQTAWYICKKLYQEFVYEVADEAIVQDLADLFIANNFEIAPVIRTLLKSAHFFDAQVIGARITSPAEMMVRFLKEAGVAADEHFKLAFWASWGLEQVLTVVPSVNGWPRHRNWISTTTLPERWAICGWMLWESNEAPQLDLIGMLSQLTDISNPHIAFKVAPAFVEHLFAIPIEELDIEEVSAGFAGDLTTHPIPQEILDGPPYVLNLTKLFLNGVPWYEWSPYNTDLDWVLRLFLMQIAQIPEFQLT